MNADFFDQLLLGEATLLDQGGDVLWKLRSLTYKIASRLSTEAKLAEAVPQSTSDTIPGIIGSFPMKVALSKTTIQ